MHFLPFKIHYSFLNIILGPSDVKKRTFWWQIWDLQGAQRPPWSPSWLCLCIEVICQLYQTKIHNNHIVFIKYPSLCKIYSWFLQTQINELTECFLNGYPPLKVPRSGFWQENPGRFMWSLIIIMSPTWEKQHFWNFLSLFLNNNFHF